MFVVLCLGVIATLIEPVKYEAQSQAFLSTSSASDVTDLNVGANYSQSLVQSFSTVATTPIVLNRVIDNLSLPYDADRLASEVTVSGSSTQVILTIAASDRSAQRAANIANEVTSVLASTVVQLSPETDSESSVKLTQIRVASIPSSPSSPNIAINCAIIVAMALIAGVAAALTRDRTDRIIRTSTTLERWTTAPVVGTVSSDEGLKRGLLVDFDASGSRVAEDFRSLRTSLSYVDAAEPSKVLVVTSSIASEGKTTTVANLASALARSGASVLLVDADLRRPKLADYMGLEGSIGLSDLLIGACSVDQATQSWREDALKVVSAGHRPPNPSELLQSDAMREFVTYARSTYDYVLLDSPPVLPVTDSVVLAHQADGVIVACGARVVRGDQVHETIKLLSQSSVRVFGVILTRAPIREPGSRKGYAYEY